MKARAYAVALDVPEFGVNRRQIYMVIADSIDRVPELALIRARAVAGDPNYADEIRVTTITEQPELNEVVVDLLATGTTANDAEPRGFGAKSVR